jgi:hypothetical protein
MIVARGTANTPAEAMQNAFGGMGGILASLNDASNFVEALTRGGANAIAVGGGALPEAIQASMIEAMRRAMAVAQQAAGGVAVNNGAGSDDGDGGGGGVDEEEGGDNDAEGDSEAPPDDFPDMDLD